MEMVSKYIMNEIQIGEWGKKIWACCCIMAVVLCLHKIGIRQEIVHSKPDTYAEQEFVEVSGNEEMLNPAICFLLQSDSLIEQKRVSENAGVLTVSRRQPIVGEDDAAGAKNTLKRSSQISTGKGEVMAVRQETVKNPASDITMELVKHPEVSLETPVEEQEEAFEPVWKVILDGNGGTMAQSEYTFDTFMFDTADFDEPKRLGKEFTGWYEDKACTRRFIKASEEIKELILYAGWKEFDGFVSDDKGYITECINGSSAIVDGFLVLPSHESCVGIETGALRNIRKSVMEVYIPSNIQYIAPDTFVGLPFLMFIEVSAENPSYYSENGALYKKDGTLIAAPAE